MPFVSRVHANFDHPQLVENPIQSLYSEFVREFTGLVQEEEVIRTNFQTLPRRIQGWLTNQSTSSS